MPDNLPPDAELETLVAHTRSMAVARLDCTLDAAADALEAQAREIERLKAQLERWEPKVHEGTQSATFGGNDGGA